MGDEAPQFRRARTLRCAGAAPGAGREGGRREARARRTFRWRHEGGGGRIRRVVVAAGAGRYRSGGR
jgi:hypothetical protein